MVKVETRNAEWFQKTDKKNAEKLKPLKPWQGAPAKKPQGNKI